MAKSPFERPTPRCPFAYTSEPFTIAPGHGKLALGDRMKSSSVANNQRRGSRTKAVLPVRVKGRDRTGETFEDLVHTLDVTQDGVRLGSVRRELNLMEEVTIFFRQRKIQFRVVWIKKLKGTSEFQIGLKAVMHDRDSWGLSLPEYKSLQAASQASA